MVKRSNFGPSLDPKNLFCRFYLYWMLDFVASCSMYFKERLWSKLKKNGKKTHFRLDLGLLGPNLGCQKVFFFLIWLYQSIEIIFSYYYVQYQKKLMMQSRENSVTDEQMDRQMGESDFIGCCPTKVEYPKKSEV